MTVIIKKLFVIMTCLFLTGCTHHEEMKSPLLTSSSQSLLPKQQSIQDWTISLNSVTSSNLPKYEMALTYKGDTKAENIVIETGNATVNLPLIEKNQNMNISSSYSSNETEIKVTVSWDVGVKAFKQAVLFDIH